MAWSNIGGGGGENVSAEVARQKQLIEEMESLYKGKTTGADATAEDILEGKKAYVGRKLTIGTHPDVTAEVEEQTPLIQQIREAIVGKATLANATPDKIVKGFSAYVGQELVNGTLEPLDLANLFGCSKINIETFTYSEKTITNTPVNHSFGEIPAVVLIMCDKSKATENLALMSYTGMTYGSSVINGGGICKTSSGNNITAFANGTCTDSTIKIENPGQNTYQAGVEYTLITMA